MNYVYVLTSTLQDTYYEQCLLSVVSLRHFNKNATIILVTDDKTYNTLNGKRSKLSHTVDKVIKVDFPAEVKSVIRSRAIKTQLNKYIKENFLYIDCDTVIANDLSSIENYKEPIMGVLDAHSYLIEHVNRPQLTRRDKILGFRGVLESGFSINGGVMLYNKCKKADAFFTKWHELWLYCLNVKKDFHDMGALAESLRVTGLSENIKESANIDKENKEPPRCLLPGEWNCQLSIGGLAYLENAKIIHYFSSHFNMEDYKVYYKLACNEVMNRIREVDDVPSDIQKMAFNPRFQFNRPILLLHDKQLKIMNEPLIQALQEINYSNPLAYKTIQAIFTFPIKVVNKIKKVLGISKK